jgi:hypothetical protein
MNEMRSRKKMTFRDPKYLDIDIVIKGCHRQNLPICCSLDITTIQHSWHCYRSFLHHPIAARLLINLNHIMTDNKYYSADEALPVASNVTPMVSVVAPSNLPEGYTLDAIVNGQSVKVTIVRINYRIKWPNGCFTDTVSCFLSLCVSV